MKFVFFVMQTFNNAIITKFSSIDMKMVRELKGKLKLITVSKETWEIWMRLFNAHNNREFVNLDMKNTYKQDL